MSVLGRITFLTRHAGKPAVEVPRFSAAQVWRWLRLYGYHTPADATTGPRAGLLTPEVDVHHAAMERMSQGEQPAVAS